MMCTIAMNGSGKNFAKKSWLVSFSILGIATTAVAVEYHPTSTAGTSSIDIVRSDVIDPSSSEKLPLLRGGKTTISDSNPTVTIPEEDQPERRRRLGVSNKECILYQIDTEFGTGEDHEQKEEKSSEDFILLGAIEGADDPFNPEKTWACQFDKQYALEVLGLSDPLVDLIGVPLADFGTLEDSHTITNDFLSRRRNRHVESGKTIMTFKNAIIDRKDNTMYVDLPSTKLETPGYTQDDTRRRLAPPTIVPFAGEKRTLVVRLTMADAMYLESSRGGPALSEHDVRKHVYENPVSLKRKYEECSYNKTKIVPFDGTTESNARVQGGVATIELPRHRSDEIQQEIDELSGAVPRAKLVRYAREAAESELGDLEKQFDFVLFCLPEGVTGFLALAILNRFDSYYTSPWCTRPSFQLHEAGHSIGMDHAGEEGVYDDKVGYMGFSYNNVDGPSMCFNPSNNYYLGWYEEQADWYDPLSDVSPQGRKFLMVGVDDYDPTKTVAKINHSKRHPVTVSELVVLQLHQTDEDTDFYIGYNRNTGINSGTSENINEVLILQRMGLANQSATTKKIATLKLVGDIHEIRDFNGESGRSVYVSFESLAPNGTGVVVRVSREKPAPIDPDAPVDRADFLWKGNPNRDCTWVGKKPENRCRRSWMKKTVGAHWCPATCAGVDITVVDIDCSRAFDKPGFDFNFDSRKNCHWVAAKKKRQRNRVCKTKHRGESVATFWCPMACKRCRA